MTMPKGARDCAALDQALYSIDVLRDIDLMLVPVRPTETMMESARAASGLSSVQIRLVYESMVRASIPDLLDDEA